MYFYSKDKKVNKVWKCISRKKIPDLENQSIFPQ